MSTKSFWGIAACALFPLAVGCAVPEQGVVRGQDPGEAVPWAGQSCSTCAAGGQWAPYESGTPFHHALNHGAAVDGGGCLGDHYPTHYHTFSYEQPHDLRYPPANVPGAVVQYPYYTLRGPTDFFLD